MPADVIVQIAGPWGNQLDLTPQLNAAVAIAVILIAAYLLVRLTHVLVRGILSTLVSREIQATTTLTPEEVKKRSETIEALFVNVVRFFVSAIAGLMIIQTAFRLDIGPAIAGLGIAGIAIGLGTQSLVRDYLNGALILIENQFSIGDVVSLAGVSGHVEDFTLRRTMVRDADGTLHSIPNGQISIASNMTRGWARVRIEVRLSYGSDVTGSIDRVNAVCRALTDDPEWGPRILETPHVERVDALGETAATLLIQGRTRPGDQWAVAGELRKRLLPDFGEKGLSIPVQSTSGDDERARG